MSAHHPGAGAGPKRFGCSPIKVVRELGSERRETVRLLSAVGVEIEVYSLVREDRDEHTSGVPVVAPATSLGS